jgi:RES domain-containing protein
MDRNLAAAVASASAGEVRGTFYRHVSPRVRRLTGSAAGGRWGPPGAYSVLYLGRPVDSVAAEAYRHLVDNVEGMTPENVGPRRLLTCEVAVTQVLDLRDDENLKLIGLTPADLLGTSYETCSRVGQAAHQLELHGVIAPAATELGETLALFELHLPTAELPILTNDELWATLPVDPRDASQLERQLWSGIRRVSRDGRDEDTQD